jgi:hypothetical protein
MPELRNVRAPRSTHRRAKVQVGTIRKDQRDMRREQYQARLVKFNIGQEVIETVQDFKYLGRITSDDDDDLPAVRKHEEARKRWAPSIETPSTRRRNGEDDGQDLPTSGRAIGTPVRIRDMGTFRANERHAGRLPQSMRTDK